jgi:hypothetical protein
MYKIERVIDLLATPDQWRKGTLWTHDGRNCIRAAIMAVDGLGTLRPIVLRAINEVTGRHYWSIQKFNDHPNTDHAQVVEVLARPHGPSHGTSGQSTRAGWVGSPNGRLDQQARLLAADAIIAPRRSPRKST